MLISTKYTVQILEERESVQVTIEGLKELEKVNATIWLRDLDYNAKSKKSYVNFVVMVYAEEIKYRYSGTLISGTAASKRILTIAMDPSEIKPKQKLPQLEKVVNAELNAVKEEIRGLMKSGVSRVTVEFNDIVDRIMAKLETEE